MYLLWFLEVFNELIMIFLKDIFKVKVSIFFYYVIVILMFEYIICLVMVIMGCVKEWLLQFLIVFYVVWEIGEFVFVMYFVED